MMTVTASIVSGVLVLNYAVRNNSDRDAYLLNRMFTDTPPEMSADLADVMIDAGAGSVTVKKGIPDLPPDMSGPPVPVAPYVTPLRAGTTFSETVRLKLPLRSILPYGQTPLPRPKLDKLVHLNNLSFALQYYWRNSGVSEKTENAYGQSVMLPYGFHEAPTFRMIRSTVAPIEVPVIITDQR